MPSFITFVHTKQLSNFLGIFMTPSEFLILLSLFLISPPSLAISSFFFLPSLFHYFSISPPTLKSFLSQFCFALPLAQHNFLEMYPLVFQEHFWAFVQRAAIFFITKYAMSLWHFSVAYSMCVYRLCCMMLRGSYRNLQTSIRIAALHVLRLYSLAHFLPYVSARRTQKLLGKLG